MKTVQTFEKILIANRGEIACRVIDTCRRLGVATVAVYSDADAGARHVALADEAVHLGPSEVAASYLRSDRIIAAAQATGAQAIHPGYGFLSENPEFAQAVVDAGLAWIGPSADAIRAMGLKDAAKTLMTRAGVPVVPGYHGPEQDPKRLAAVAKEIGYPVLIKAVAGGGGKGMRLVQVADDFDASLASARSEAKTAFGNGDVLIEKYIQNPRHIEIQVFGDNFGNAVHLFERDCSLQRRHQKVIEEAPAPGMPPAVRDTMGKAAVAAAKAIGYCGAGTVEFIVDGSNGLREDGFWFMEMNTRLQVEHPVTEEITGVDLVEWQLRVAAGEPLPMRQDDLRICGHAFEARLYAEDVPAGFLPATGRLTHLAFAADARAETGVRSGDEISPYYDPMIAKLVVHGANRSQALAKLDRALQETQISGLVTNQTFLRQLAQHRDFAKGVVSTHSIDQWQAAGEPPIPAPEYVALAVLHLAQMGRGPKRHTGFALWQPLRRAVWYDLGAGPQAAHLEIGRETVLVDLGATQHRAVWQNAWLIDGRKMAAHLIQDDHGVSVYAEWTWRVDAVDLRHRAVDTDGADDEIAAPMPGLLKMLDVGKGDQVAAGQRLGILEAMKMEHPLIAPYAARVASLGAAAGDQVDKGTTLIRLERPDD